MDPKDLKELAVQANNQVWTILGQCKGTLEPDLGAQALENAYLSLHLWRKIGTDLHLARAHWLICRVACVLKLQVLALEHSALCKKHTMAAKDRKDFDEAYMHESEARAAALAGNHPAARAAKEKAQAFLVKDPEDREIFQGDLNSEPWFGI